MADASKEPVTQFGSYRLRRRIGAGGMAELFLAESCGPNGFCKPVVLKMIHSYHSKDAGFVSMFTHEATILAGFTHGNVVPIFDFGKIDGRHYLAMEYVDGVDLEMFIEAFRIKGIPLSEELALWVGASISAGLHYSHRATDKDGKPLQVVHRDVSPNNILLSKTGEVKLCDFGIAFSNIKEAGTDAGLIKGKLHYLSPEQALAKPLDCRSDIFSLGVTLYEMLAGHHPIVNGSGVTVLRTLTNGTGYPSLADAAPWLTPHITGVIDKAIDFDPSKRFQTAEEFRVAINNVLYKYYEDFSPAVLGNVIDQIHSEGKLTPTSPMDKGMAHPIGCHSLEKHTTPISTLRVPSRELLNMTKWIWISALIGMVILGTMALGGSAGKDLHRTRTALAPIDFLHQSLASYLKWKKPVTDGKPLTKSPIPVQLSDDGEDANVKDTGEMVEPQSRNIRRPNGTLHINAVPWADVKINGKNYGTTPLLGLSLRPGRHVATFSNPDFTKRIIKNIVIKSKEETKLIVELIP